MVNFTHLLTLLIAQYGIIATALPRQVRQASPPSQYAANRLLDGLSDDPYQDSAHFRVYGADAATANKTLGILEAAHQCFVQDLGWRTPGLDNKKGRVGKEVGPWYKMKVYKDETISIRSAAGATEPNYDMGLALLRITEGYLTSPRVLGHEFGHAMHFSEKRWWETVANFVAELYVATPTCDQARSVFGVRGGDSIIHLTRVIGDSHQVIVDATSGSSNHYHAWPFLSYITNSPDSYSGLGKQIVLDMIRKYPLNSNETPLHTIERLLGRGVGVQKVIGRYWARMAYVDIGNAKAQSKFNLERKSLNYANLDDLGHGRYMVKAARAPRYMGANIIPLKASASKVSVTVMADGSYTATLAVKGGSSTRYVELNGGKGEVTLASDEGLSLVVANTPTLVQYDAFNISAELNRGLIYSVQLFGAIV
ncbi:hypothetical protein BDV95DRAFT_618110 [Massariosphaeria phaeospora]|uniref:Uncharacterized protein n=1 Tax=Massariosphaeria phaeospora TaxID=100035 RepID=A0A7C8M721_9PLEO|nr:hypothetical protein BDV95DRAFT_618110 [Massariosphaeria phaeospora]